MTMNAANTAGHVVADISMSVDGYVTGPGPRLEHGLGREGEALHQWVLSSHESPTDWEILEGTVERTGAVVMGHRTFDFVDGPHGWDDDIGYGYDHEPGARPLVFVVTHRMPRQTRLTEGFTFVTDGIVSAVRQARDAAGDGEVSVMGGAETIDRALDAGVVDLLRIHLSPVLMGRGTRLFALVNRQIDLRHGEVVTTPYATHLTYRLTPDWRRCPQPSRPTEVMSCR
jgi:dihydrofolate reductase